jgi:hypothetical protein
MKNINDVLRLKEQQIQQLQRETETLRAAARLLVEESDQAPAPRPASSTNVAVPAMPAPQMVMRPAQPVPTGSAPKESNTYVAASAWDVPKPQFP